MANKHALLVGVDRYSRLESKYQLSGCVSDARLISSVLVDHFHFDPANITELHDEQATREGMLTGMRELVDRVQKDDVVVFHFSGHGSRRTTMNPEKAGGKDNTIMPSDSGRDPDPNLDITDDEIYDWLSGLAAKTRNITLVFDCCHSGTMTRDIFAGTPRSGPEDTRSLAEMGIDSRQVPKVSIPATRSTGAGWLGQSDAYVVISGCRDHEVSNEFSREEGSELIRNGALTHYLTRALMRAAPGTTYRDVYEIVCQGVGAQFPNQHPQIEGTVDRQVLGVEDVEPMRFVAVSGIDGERITLAGGAAHGLRQGSRWRAYVPGTKRAEGADSLGLIEVTRVGSLSSDARVIDALGEIVPGARCVEVPGSAGPRTLRVDISRLAEREQAECRAAIAAAELVEVANGPDDAQIRAYVVAPRDDVAPEDPAPQLGAVSKPCWVFVGLDGQLVLPPQPVSGDRVPEGSSLGAQVKRLDAIARFRNTLRLENPDCEFDVGFNIYQRRSEGEWVLANGGDSVFHEGDRIAFEVVNRMDVPVYVSILDLCTDGEIFLLYPPNEDGERIEAGATFTFGQGSRSITLSLPRSTFVPDEGVETLKAFITTSPANFTWLTQPAVFDAATEGVRKGVIGSEHRESADWKAINRSYILKR